MTHRLDLAQHALDVAPALLGAFLVSDTASGHVVARIVEVEAYGGVGEDPGSHAFHRLTTRNAAMFAEPGTAYVYFTYGMHWCMNVVTRPAGVAGAVLIRAARVVGGLEIARARRTTSRHDGDLCRGPARLTVALGITGACTGQRIRVDSHHANAINAFRVDPDLHDPDLQNPGPSDPDPSVPGARPVGTDCRLALLVPDGTAMPYVQGPRSGVRGPGSVLPWRFAIEGEPAVSPYRPAGPRPPIGARRGGSGQIG
ncbi:MAG: DNA-3-methyladenine glycosylase [Actinobacteria bacterium]|nr:DNA-3-methyladenine glycosylase [Actinomycetota bacterium]